MTLKLLNEAKNEVQAETGRRTTISSVYQVFVSRLLYSYRRNDESLRGYVGKTLLTKLKGLGLHKEGANLKQRQERFNALPNITKSLVCGGGGILPYMVTRTLCSGMYKRANSTPNVPGSVCANRFLSFAFGNRWTGDLKAALEHFDSKKRRGVSVFISLLAKHLRWPKKEKKIENAKYVCQLHALKDFAESNPNLRVIQLNVKYNGMYWVYSNEKKVKKKYFFLKKVLSIFFKKNK